MKRTAKNISLKTVAGVAALSILPGIISAQQQNTQEKTQQFVSVKNEEGIIVQQKTDKQFQKEIILFGKFSKSTYGYPYPGFPVKIGYYAHDPAMGKLFYTYKEFEVQAKGKFKISLTVEEYEVLCKNSVSFISDDYIIEITECDLAETSKKIILKAVYRPSHSEGILD